MSMTLEKVPTQLPNYLTHLTVLKSLDITASPYMAVTVIVIYLTHPRFCFMRSESKQTLRARIARIA